jgi:hypothetical protein
MARGPELNATIIVHRKCLFNLYEGVSDAQPNCSRHPLLPGGASPSDSIAAMPADVGNTGGWESKKIASAGALLMRPVVVAAFVVRTCLERGFAAGGLREETFDVSDDWFQFVE